MLCSPINLKVLMTKKQDLQTDDFIIVPQTLVQAEMLKEFGGKVVCVDATHGINAYEFKLITLLVV